MTRNTGNGKSKERPLDDMGLTRQQVLEMGQAAADTLRAPIYNATHHLVVQEIIEEWASTAPKEQNRRESLWYELQATGKVANRMLQMTERAKELLERQGAEQSQRENEYLDQQGFGFGEQYQAPDQFQ